MKVDKYLAYRGVVKSAVGVGGTLTFVTVHDEKQPTGVYRVDTEKMTLTIDALPAGGVDIIADGNTLWVAGSDGQIYKGALKGGKPTAVGTPFNAAPTALALLAKDRLAVLVGSDITILSRKDGKALQTLQLPEAGTCIAADRTGQWLVAGTGKGTVAVIDCEDKDEFALGESAKLHEGAVTALLFEQEELRFYSAGADQKLLSTHARGKLEPEDKGRGNNHTEPVTTARCVFSCSTRPASSSRRRTPCTTPAPGPSTNSPRATRRSARRPSRRSLATTTRRRLS
jgi:ParB family chromosome partitioning protein